MTSSYVEALQSLNFYVVEDAVLGDVVLDDLEHLHV